MDEILIRDINRNEFFSDGKQITIAYGDESFLPIFILLSLIAFAFLLTFLLSTFKKYQILSGNLQFYSSFILSLIFCVAFVFYIQKVTFLDKVNRPTSQRKNLIAFDVETKKVSIQEEYKIIDTYSLAPGDYFYLGQTRSKNITAYYLDFVHNNESKSLLTYVSIGESINIQNYLTKLNFQVKKGY